MRCLHLYRLCLPYPERAQARVLVRTPGKNLPGKSYLLLFPSPAALFDRWGPDDPLEVTQWGVACGLCSPRVSVAPSLPAGSGSGSTAQQAPGRL